MTRAILSLSLLLVPAACPAETALEAPAHAATASTLRFRAAWGKRKAMVTQAALALSVCRLVFLDTDRTRAYFEYMKRRDPESLARALELGAIVLEDGRPKPALLERVDFRRDCPRA